MHCLLVEGASLYLPGQIKSIRVVLDKISFNLKRLNAYGIKPNVDKSMVDFISDGIINLNLRRCHSELLYFKVVYYVITKNVAPLYTLK